MYRLVHGHPRSQGRMILELHGLAYRHGAVMHLCRKHMPIGLGMAILVPMVTLTMSMTLELHGLAMAWGRPAWSRCPGT